jgi:5-methyltetrahydropteroyltriglutamate--homocysteine methyltransferase
MNRSTDRIFTTHAGSLSRPANLIAMGRARVASESADAVAFAHVLAAAVADVVRKQRELGIDIPDDGRQPTADPYCGEMRAETARTQG